MKAAITVELDGATFVLDERAYQALRSYLDRAAARLRNHPDRAEVIARLERSITAKLARAPGAQGASLGEDAMLAALKEVGRVDGPELGEPGAAAPGASAGGPSAEGPWARGPWARGPSADGASARRPWTERPFAGAHRGTRRLYRIREGQQIAGVCTGLSAFSEIDVGIIRFIFLLGTMFSGGVLLVGYIVLAFVMPIARTDAERAEARGGLPAG